MITSFKDENYERDPDEDHYWTYQHVHAGELDTLESTFAKAAAWTARAMAEYKAYVLMC